MLLVVWAASFGLDERGLPLDNHLNADLLPLTHTKSEDDALNNHKFKDGVQDVKWHEKRDKTDTMLREVLELIDFHGVMRRPSLDGVRALLLILPLLEGSNFYLHQKLLFLYYIRCPTHGTNLHSRNYAFPCPYTL